MTSFPPYNQSEAVVSSLTFIFYAINVINISSFFPLNEVPHLINNYILTNICKFPFVERQSPSSYQNGEHPNCSKIIKKNLTTPPLPIIRLKEVHFQYSIRQEMTDYKPISALNSMTINSIFLYFCGICIVSFMNLDIFLCISKRCQ